MKQLLRPRKQHQLRAEYYAINQRLYSDTGTPSCVPAMQISLARLFQKNCCLHRLCVFSLEVVERNHSQLARGQQPFPHLTCLMVSSGSSLDTCCCCHELFLPPECLES